MRDPEEVRRIESLLNAPSLPGGTTEATPDDLLVGRIAIERNLIRPEQLSQCLREQEAAPGKALGDLFLEKGWLKPAELADLLREKERRSEGVLEIPRYDIRQRLGQGATAIVYRGWDRDLGRPVAVKVLRESAGMSEVARQRFRREAQTAAGIAHPHVVMVYDAGEASGQLYLVMELVEGRPLSEALRSKTLGERELLRLLEKAARGVAAAHAKGVVHRDLKPANILVTGPGEPKVGDFGLAHLVDSTTELTKTGAVLGTPLYMSPEQVEGRARDVTPRTDVYALGAILYELLVGRPPHVGETTMEIYGKIVRDDPVPPRRLNAKVTVELETVTLKALDKEPYRRYPSAAEFAEDLRRYLDGEPITARRASTVRRVWRKAVKNRAILLPLAAAAVTALAATGWLVRGAVRKAGDVRRALAAAAEAEGRGDTGRARDEFLKALDLDPASGEAAAGFSRAETEIVRRARAREEALKHLETARHALDAATRYLYHREARYDGLVARVEPAQKLIEEAAAKDPALALAPYLLGRAWEVQGFDDRAEASLRKAIELDGDFTPAHYQLGRLLLGQAYRQSLGPSAEEREAKRPEAERLAREATREIELAVAGGFEDGLQRELARAMLAYTARDAESVRRIAAGALAEFKEREGAEEFHWLLGLLGTPAERLEAFGRALALRPHYPLVRMCRAATLLAVGDLAGAVADCEEALRINPRLAEAYFNRGVARSAQGDPAGAIQDFSMALAVDPRYAHAYVNRGIVRSQGGDGEGAVLDFESALALQPSNWIARYNRGVTRSNRGDAAGALADFEETLKLNPRFPQAYNDRGRVRARQGDLRGALRDYGEAVRLDPAFAEAHNNRGIVHLREADHDLAVADFARALELNPRFAEAYFNRGLARLERDQFRDAEEDLSRALQLKGDWALAYAMRAQARDGAGQRKGAADDARRALRTPGLSEPDRREVEKLLGELGEKP